MQVVEWGGGAFIHDGAPAEDGASRPVTGLSMLRGLRPGLRQGAWESKRKILAPRPAILMSLPRNSRPEIPPVGAPSTENMYKTREGFILAIMFIY